MLLLNTTAAATRMSKMKLRKNEYVRCRRRNSKGKCTGGWTAEVRHSPPIDGVHWESLGKFKTKAAAEKAILDARQWQ